MKLDRLIALIKLANGNPNEHEANAAARKVCRELLDPKGKFLDFIVTEKRPREESRRPQTTSTREKPFPDIWEDLMRQAGFRSPTGRRPPYGVNPDIWDYLNRQPGQKAPEPESWDRETRQEKTQKQYYSWDDPFIGKKEKRPEALRKCSKCGLEVMTRRLNEDPWVCNPCHWKEAKIGETGGTSKT